MLRVLGAIADVIGGVLEYLRWRDDWDRTWSPVSYFLAVFSLLALIAVVWIYGAMAWAAVVRTFG